MTRRWRVATAVACGACIASTRPARAQTADDSATAERLFAKGSALVGGGHYGEGCPLLERAQKLVAGIGVTLYVGACYEQRGELLRAWQEFRSAGELAGAKGDRRAAVALARAERLWPRLARIRVVVPAISDATDLVIADDDVPLPRSAWSTERPVEARVHRIRASAPQRQPWELSVDVPAGPAAITVEIPLLRPLPAPAVASSLSALAAPASPASAPAPPPPAPPPPALAERIASPLGWQRVAGLAVVGVGAVAAGIGAAFGLDAKNKLDDSNSSGHCHSNDHCDAAGIAERSDALTSAAFSTGSFVLGGACLAGGGALYLTAPTRESAVSLSPRVEHSGASVVVQGRW
jgi:hypothetical protein